MCTLTCMRTLLWWMYLFLQASWECGPGVGGAGLKLRSHLGWRSLLQPHKTNQPKPTQTKGTSTFIWLWIEILWSDLMLWFLVKQWTFLELSLLPILNTTRDDTGKQKLSKQIFAEAPSDQNTMWNGHRHFFLNTPSYTSLFKVRGREGGKSSATRTFDGKSTWFCRHERSQHLDLLKLIMVRKLHPKVFTVFTSF